MFLFHRYFKGTTQFFCVLPIDDARPSTVLSYIKTLPEEEQEQLLLELFGVEADDEVPTVAPIFAEDVIVEEYYGEIQYFHTLSQWYDD